ncbi:fumarylacetoacetate hydrolase family protein [Rhodoferax sp. BAB1]|uniref:fumarylacetoacetate hydrolase family protein n=1 Tax=Rhodoferax sp. BAB1 TaxID=2741720 RepID=UPI0015758AA0|nr:fumarylacetoacetate hydrolase family protein [Rhodoferax sp. BAB1]QKO23263.1 fumarylacetoacetate hydrolase family protein [Rhodoferax sp. BAB1]
MSMAPVWSAGTVYGVLLNSKDEWDSWAGRMSEPPYKAPPKAPVLYVKTANTWSACDATISVPGHAPEVEVGASLALVIGTAAHQVTATGALQHVAGYVLVNDLSLPHASYYRPPVKYKNLDGFLGIGPRCATLDEVGDPSRLRLEVRIDGRLQQTVDLGRMLRPAAQLIADVSEFMTLRHGDVLLLGLGAKRPLARAGQRIEIRAGGVPALGVLTNTLVKEQA